MGAGAVKEANPSDDVPKDIRISSEEMSCESCSVNFTIIKRKKACFDCGKNHCSNCMTKPPSGKSSVRRCKRCQLMTSGNFTRGELMTVPTKDLRSFLVRRKIPMNNCTEKTDLVDLLLSTSNNSHYKKEQAERQRHLVELEERKRRRDVESAHWGRAQPSQSAATEQPPPVHNHADTQSTTSSGEPPTSDISDTISTPAADTVAETAADTAAQNTESQELADSNPTTTNDTSSIRDEPLVVEVVEVIDDSGAQSTEQPQNSGTSQITDDSPVTTRKLARLHDVKTVDDIEDLTVRQLKEILATNYVAYAGCCEKFELIERVRRLWHDKQKNDEKAQEMEKTNDDGNIASGEVELCKICMDAVIDCVLLDCGHMVSCTQCGKQMAECPMCRQYVVRVVHVFKA